jgi:hypothetical protein
VQCFGGMQPGAANLETVHRCDELLANLPALADATDDELAAAVYGARDVVDGLHEPFLRNGVGLVDLDEMRQTVSFCGYDLESCAQSGFVADCVEDLIGVGRGHGQLGDGLADVGEGGGEEGRDGRQRKVFRHSCRHCGPLFHFEMCAFVRFELDIQCGDLLCERRRCRQKVVSRATVVYEEGARGNQMPASAMETLVTATRIKQRKTWRV